MQIASLIFILAVDRATVTRVLPEGPTSRIAVDSNGNIYFTVAGAYRIRKTDSQGRLISTWGKVGHKVGELDDPTGLAIDDQNNIYVADNGNSRVQKFDDNGNLLLMWGSQGVGSGKFKSVEAVTIDQSAGYIYVSDYLNDCIQKFDLAGKFLSQLGTCGLENTAKEQAWSPGSMAVDRQGNLYVADGANARIRKFDRAGHFLRDWDNHEFDNRWYFPNDIAIDNEGRVYVTESEDGRIDRFDTEGHFQAFLGSPGRGNGEFYYPQGIETDQFNNLYVSDWSGRYIQKFDASGRFLARWKNEIEGLTPETDLTFLWSIFWIQAGLLSLLLLTMTYQIFKKLKTGYFANFRELILNAFNFSYKSGHNSNQARNYIVSNPKPQLSKIQHLLSLLKPKGDRWFWLTYLGYLVIAPLITLLVFTKGEEFNSYYVGSLAFVSCVVGSIVFEGSIGRGLKWAWGTFLVLVALGFLVFYLITIPVIIIELKQCADEGRFCGP
jgi:DNA-binding beta-propeller fold protein YncE